MIAALLLLLPGQTISSTVATSSAAAVLADTSSVAIALTPPILPDEGQLKWDEAWPRFSTPEYIATGALVVLNSIGGYIVPKPQKVLWHGGILFDDDLRDYAIQASRTTKQRLKVAGDYAFPALTVIPIAFDSLIVSWLIRGSFDVGMQTALISLQSLLTSSFLNLLAKRLTARTRPNVPDCEERGMGRGDPACNGGGAIRSFYSGHTGMAATGAGLICVTHEYLDLFGGGWADHLMCAGAIAGATFVGVSRVVNDAHYATDSIAGVIVGLVTGVIMPVALHYGDHFTEPRFYVAPSMNSEEMSLTLGGSF